MKKSLIRPLYVLTTMCALLLVLPAAGKAPKKAKVQPLLWPDGQPVGEWFQKAEVPEPASLGKTYNLRDFGAVSDPAIVQTALIQKAIDQAAADGGGVVVIPEGVYKSGALFFKQGTHLYLSRGAVLLGSESIFDFPLIQTRIEGEICKYFSALINVDHLDGLFSRCGILLLPGIHHLRYAPQGLAQDGRKSTAL